MCESVRQAIQLSEVKYKYSGGADFISALKETTAYTARIHTQTHIVIKTCTYTRTTLNLDKDQLDLATRGISSGG